LVADLELVLASDECKPLAHLEQEPLDLRDEAALDLRLGGALIEAEPLE
jgi:hypothetical protein